MRRRLVELIGRWRAMPRRSRLDDELREEICWISNLIERAQKPSPSG